MFKLFKESFYKTNDCIILTVPLIIFLSIIGLYFGYAKMAVTTCTGLIFSYITIIIMLAGLSAAWFYMTKKALRLSNKVIIFDNDRTREILDLFKQLLKGVGKLFFPMLTILVIVNILYALFFIALDHIISNYIAPIDITTLGISSSFMSTEEIFHEIADLPETQIIALNCWYILTGLFTFVLTFFCMLWVPEVVYGTKNPFKALFYSFQNILSDIKNYILLFSFVVILYVSVSIINAFLMIYPPCYFIVLLISYYFILYVVVLLFTYYERQFLSGKN